jgi:hypothetical protein
MINNIQEKKEYGGLSESVLEKIETEHVDQVPRWQFMLSEYVIWVLWALSVCIGAVAFSLIIFFMIHAGLAPFEATHDDLFRFFLEVMPYAWVIVFALMALLAHYNLRHTKRGYRFAVWQVLASSIVVSFFGGVALHASGVGFHVDHLIGERMPALPSFHMIETRMWQHPQEGRMIGTFKEMTERPNVVLFRDFEGENWELDTEELNPLDLETLMEGTKVRVVGLISTSSHRAFYGCGVFPFSTDRNLSFRELKAERERFIKRMEAHHQYVIDELIKEGIPRESRCATHRAVIRIKSGQ